MANYPSNQPPRITVGRVFMRENTAQRGANPPVAFISITIDDVAQLAKHADGDGKVRLSAPLWLPREARPNGPKYTGPVNIDTFVPGAPGNAQHDARRAASQQRGRPELDDEIPF